MLNSMFDSVSLKPLYVMKPAAGCGVYLLAEHETALSCGINLKERHCFIYFCTVLYYYYYDDRFLGM